MDIAGTIRAARAAYNEAIAARDPDRIAVHLVDHYVLITSRNEMLHGRDSVRRHWAEKFAGDENVAYTRTPAELEIDDAGLTAAEYGRWDGRYTLDGTRVSASGTYVARWQRDGDGRWRLRAEHFT